MDSVTNAGAVGGPVRDLVGWLDPEGGDPEWRADPGVVVKTAPGTDRVLPDPAGYFCALRASR